MTTVLRGLSSGSVGGWGIPQVIFETFGASRATIVKLGFSDQMTRWSPKRKPCSNGRMSHPQLLATIKGALIRCGVYFDLKSAVTILASGWRRKLGGFSASHSQLSAACRSASRRLLFEFKDAREKRKVVWRLLCKTKMITL